MRIVLLCANKSNQNALAAKILKDFNLAGIVIEDKKTKHPFSIPYFISKIVDRILFFKIASSWQAMLTYYKKQYAEVNQPQRFITSNINSSEVVDFIKQLKPDLIMVSGTSLIRDKILDLTPPKGIINLHTGLSPYVKGGPNCTNWCIANNTFQLIGNTIMWIDKGIDSGNIITTEKVVFNGTESLNEVHIKVMEHAHNLYIRALHAISDNIENCPSVKQSDIAKGDLYLTRMWNFKAKFKFIIHLLHLKSGLLNTQNKSNAIDTIRLVSLPDISSPADYHR